MVRRFITLAAVSLLCLARPALAQKSDSKVKVKTTATKPDERGVQTVTLELTIEPEWYIYANPVKNEGQENSQTTLKIQSASKLAQIKIDYPEGKEKTLIGETMRIYEGKTAIQVSFQRPTGDKNALKLILHVSACRATECLLPARIIIDVP